MTTRPLALAYVRVSTDDQAENGASLAAQTLALTEEAERRGWDVEIVREEGKSAKSLNRPALTEARARLARGEAQYLLCVRLDRLSRSVADFAALVTEARRKGWGIVLQSPNIDFSDPAGEFTANVLASAAQYERALISARVREGMAQRKSEGQHMGRSADPAMLDTYRRVLALAAEGRSHNSIAAQLTAEGVPTARGGAWAAATVRRMVLSETAKSL
jgi:DNA invertase Pin-like site-specific DNA recombinase